MKKKLFTLPFKSNFFKEQDPFHLVIVFFIIFFGTAIFFSIPTFYDYEKYKQKIEKTINKEFKININNFKDISFRFIPSPHLLIKKADLKIKDSEKSVISELKNVKIFISLVDFYNKDIFKIKRIEVNKANLYLDQISLVNFINNLKKNIVNNFIIKKSTLFFRDRSGEIILISTIKNFDYKIDFLNNKKILKIKGNIFDSDYEFKYIIDYNYPNIQNTTLELRNPNIYFENNLVSKLNSNQNFKRGKLNSKFLSKTNDLSYEIIDNTITFLDKDIKNSNFSLDGSINFKPFHFNLTMDLNKINLYELENLLYFLHKNENLKYENLSGVLKINLNDIENKSFKKGWLKLKFENSELSLDHAKLDINDFADLIIADYIYLDDIDQILQIKIKMNIYNKEKLNRFLFNYKKNKILSDNLYFTYQYNSNTGNSFISSVTNKGFHKNVEFYKFNNIQQLKNLLRNENLLNLD